MTEDKVLEIKNFSFQYRGEKNFFALRDIELTILKGQKVAVIGESGSGKSTLAYSILGLIPEEEMILEGEINFYPVKSCCSEVISITKLSESKLNHLRGNHISIIFQDPFSALNPVLPIGEQVEEVILNHYPQIDKNELYSKTIKLLKSVKLKDEEIVYKKFPHQLSGGQLQRICIATSIANTPELIIADEPTTALDASLREDILGLINYFISKDKISLMLITHDLSIVKNYVDYIYILYAGEILEYGEKDRLINSPLHPYTQSLLEAYPEKAKKGKPLPTIEGQIPDLTNKEFFSKCIFLNRCNKKIEKCYKMKPEFFNKKNCFVKCWLYE